MKQQKPKELVEERDEIVRLITLCNDGNVNITEEKYSKVKNYLTQQRTELENETKETLGKIISDQLNQAKIETRTELLEEIKKEINGMGFVNPAEAGQFAMHNDGYNQAIEDITNLLNKKYE